MTGSHGHLSLSVPRHYRAPRRLTGSEVAVLRAIADVLIPATAQFPAATSEDRFDEYLMRAVDARADAFGAIEDIVANAPVGADLEPYLRRMHDVEPSDFQVLSTVVAGAWLLTPGVRDRIGYHGQQRHPAGLEDAADDLMDGILEPVLTMEDESPARWAR